MGFGKKPHVPTAAVSDVCVSLGYRIENYSPDMSEAEIEQSIDKALQVWAKVTPLRFSKVSSSSADIKVSFGRQCEYDKDRAGWDSFVLVRRSLVPSPSI